MLLNFAMPGTSVKYLVRKPNKCQIFDQNPLTPSLPALPELGGDFVMGDVGAEHGVDYGRN